MYPYHNKIKQRIKNKELIQYDYVDKYKDISPCLLLYFSTEPKIRPIREHRFDKYEKLLITLFITQWVLNVSCNPTFFYYHNVLMGLIIITSLTLVISSFIFTYWSELKYKVVLILPSLIWLCIATSLNGYILLKN